VSRTALRLRSWLQQLSSCSWEWRGAREITADIMWRTGASVDRSTLWSYYRSSNDGEADVRWSAADVRRSVQYWVHSAGRGAHAAAALRPHSVQQSVLAWLTTCSVATLGERFASKQLPTPQGLNEYNSTTSYDLQARRVVGLRKLMTEKLHRTPVSTWLIDWLIELRFYVPPGTK